MEVVEEGQNLPQISLKQLKFEETVEEDRMSALPDCLIIEILSRLPSTKEAIKTCSLSKRWTHVWKWIPTLSFITRIGYDPVTQSFQNLNSRSDFVSFVDKTLTQCRHLKLNKFHVFIDYDVQFESQLNSWIRYAVSRNVEMLNLGFWNNESQVEVVFDQILFISSCFTCLRLDGFKVNPSVAISWKNLRSLCIGRGKYDEDLIQNILSGTPVLETLVLEFCYGYRQLNITSKSVKRLVLDGYIDISSISDRNMIEIIAPNISSLTIRDVLLLRNVLLVNMSSLVEAKLDYHKLKYEQTRRKEETEEMLKGLILSLRHKELNIGSCCSKAMSCLEAIRFLFSIKYEVSCCYS